MARSLPQAGLPHLIQQVVPAGGGRDQHRRNHLQPVCQLVHQLVCGCSSQRQQRHTVLPLLKIFQVQLFV
jgi:hypothetical protein